MVGNAEGYSRKCMEGVLQVSEVLVFATAFVGIFRFEILETDSCLWWLVYYTFKCISLGLRSWCPCGT